MVIKTKNVSSMYETEKYRSAGKLKQKSRKYLDETGSIDYIIFNARDVVLGLGSGVVCRNI